MDRIHETALKKALVAFGANLGELLARESLTQSALGRALKKKGYSVQTKTINNIVKARHPTKLDKLSAIADYFGVDLWVMFIPGLPKEVLHEKEKSTRLKLLIENYIKCTDKDRLHAEHVADAYAGKGDKK